MARFVQEFLGHRQIARRFPTAYVAQIGCQVRKKTLDILSFSIPGHKPFGRQTYAGSHEDGADRRNRPVRFTPASYRIRLNASSAVRCVTGLPSYVAKTVWWAESLSRIAGVSTDPWKISCFTIGPWLRFGRGLTTRARLPR